MATRYKPQPAASVASIAVFAGLTVGTAAVAAVVAHLVARSVALTLVLPAVQGLAIGAAASNAIHRQRMQRAMLAAAVTAIAAAGAVIGHAAIDYTHARADARAACASARDDYARIAGETDPALLDRDYSTCKQRLQLSGFFEQRFGIGDEPTRGGTLGFAMATIELVLAMAIAALIAAAAAREPACPRCRKWRVESSLGAAAMGDTQHLVDALLAGDTNRATASLTPPDTREAIEISVLACPDGHDGGGGILRIGERTVDKKRQIRRGRVADLVASAAEVDALRVDLTTTDE